MSSAELIKDRYLQLIGHRKLVGQTLRLARMLAMLLESDGHGVFVEHGSFDHA